MSAAPERTAWYSGSWNGSKAFTTKYPAHSFHRMLVQSGSVRGWKGVPRAMVPENREKESRPMVFPVSLVTVRHSGGRTFMRKQEPGWLLLLAAVLLAAPAAAQPLADASAEDVAHGKRVFDIHCSRCHGLDGVGGEGPNLMRENLRRSVEDDALIEIVDVGIARHRHAGSRLAEHPGDPERRRLRPLAGGWRRGRNCREIRWRARSSTT